MIRYYLNTLGLRAKYEYHQAGNSRRIVVLKTFIKINIPKPPEVFTNCIAIQ